MSRAAFIVVVVVAFARVAWGDCAPGSFDAPENTLLPFVPVLPSGNGWPGGVGGTTAGSLRWFPGPNPDPVRGFVRYEITVTSSDGQSGSVRPFVAEHEDVDATSWRIPSDVVAGETVFVEVLTQDANSSGTAPVDGTTVTPGPPASGAAPTLGALRARTITKTDGCFGSAQTTNATLISANVDGDQAGVLLLTRGSSLAATRVRATRSRAQPTKSPLRSSTVS